VHELALLPICVTAFLVVFAVLAGLAVIIHAITLLFPERRSGTDAVLIAAITSAVTALHPQARVTRIEEER